MAVTQISICNMALSHLNDTEINNIEGSSKQSRLCNKWFTQALHELLREYDWNFASARATLAQLAETPLYGWDFTYALPANYLMLRGTNCEGLYQIEDGKFLSDQDSAEIEIRYTRDYTDYNELDPVFLAAFTYYLAYYIAYGITGDRTIKAEMYQYYREKVVRAKTIDDIEDSPEEEPTPWIIVGRSVRTYGIS